MPKQKPTLAANKLRFVQSLAMRDADYNEASSRSLWVKKIFEDRNFLQSLDNLSFIDEKKVQVFSIRRVGGQKERQMEYEKGICNRDL